MWTAPLAVWALEVEEVCRLLNAMAGEPTQLGVTGSERAILYWLALDTGLRAGELRSLTRASFDLCGDSPTVTAAAGYSRRRQDLLPLRPDTVEARAVWSIPTPSGTRPAVGSREAAMGAVGFDPT